MGAKTPLVLYTNIPTSSSFQLQPETQAGIPVSAADKLRPRLSPFVIRLIPPAVLQGVVESGGPDDPYSIRNLVIPGGSIVTEITPARTAQVYGETESFIPDGIADAGALRRTEQVESYTPPDFIDAFCINDRGLSSGNNFGYTRNNGRTHMGVDIYVPMGSPVYAPFDAEIISVNRHSSPVPPNDNGSYLAFHSTENPDIRVNYIHLETVTVDVGDRVTAGQVLGTTIARNFNQGDEGRSNSHLHAEVRIPTGGYENNNAGGGNINPFSILNVANMVFAPGSEEAAQYGVTTPGNPGSGLPVTVSNDTSQQSQYPFYSTAANAGAADPYSNSVVRGTLDQIVALPRTELQRFVYEGRQVTSNTPESPVIVDKAFRADILLQLQDIAKAPPLVMMINPASFSVSHPRTQQFTNATRYGYIFEEFRQDIYSISASLQFGGFMAADGVRRGFGDFAPSTPTGLQNAAMLDSAAWQQLQSVLAVYQNNGAIFDRINKIKSRPLVGAVVIEWDGWKYTGKFTSFSFTFDETQQNFVSAEIQFEAITKEAYDDSFDPPTLLTDLNGGFESPPAPRIVSPFVQEASRRIANAFRRSETRQPRDFERTQESEETQDLQPNDVPNGQRSRRQRQR